MNENTCTFFGHRSNLPENVDEMIENSIEMLIEQFGVRKFYVGNQGKFDSTVADVLQRLKKIYVDISADIVLAYLPVNNEENKSEKLSTVYPEEVGKAPNRYSIPRRNEWMLKQSDYVISYVVYTWGGASQFTEKAIRQKKKVINLAKSMEFI